MKENRKIGIWLDYNNAQIIQEEGSASEPINISSEVDAYHIKGGSAAKVPWGPVDTVSESKLLNKRKQQLAKYYKTIVENLNSGDELLIFGPAEAKLGLQKFIEGYTKIRPSLTGVKTVKFMTENQKKEFVRNHFEN